MNRYDQNDWRSHRGFREDNDSGRTAGDDEHQPYAQDPYAYYPGQRSEQRYGGDRQSGPRREQQDRPPQRYGQREPYNVSEGRSRYSESQYGQHPYAQPQYGRGTYDRASESNRPRESFYGRDERPFADNNEAPGYFGTGNYGDGGASYGGGFDQRSRVRYPGSLDQDPLEWRGERDNSYRPNEYRSHPGYQPAPQTRHRSGPKGYTRSDDRLREDISERLMMADSIDPSDVSVTVKDAKVTLEGRVPDRRMKHAIEDLVDNCPGVQDIDNRIRVGRQESSTTTTTASKLRKE